MSPKPFALSVKALIRDRHGRLLLLRRSPESGLDPGAWDLPGGKVEPGEDFAGALLREAREETGLGIRIEGLLGAAESELPRFRVVHLVMQARFAADNGQPVRVRLSDEHVEHRWAAPGDLAGLELCPDTRSLVIALAGGPAERAGRAGGAP